MMWLSLFDLAGYIHSLLWWALFRLLLVAGVEERTITCFRSSTVVYVDDSHWRQSWQNLGKRLAA